jgi:hypothetical protein
MTEQSTYTVEQATQFLNFWARFGDGSGTSSDMQAMRHLADEMGLSGWLVDIAGGLLVERAARMRKSHPTQHRAW